VNSEIQADRKHRTITSSLWAAYGDALGFTTELANSSMLKRRTGKSDPVVATVPWERQIGGRFGAIVEMPAGTYSDDTQLRLATSRAIRQDGFFDVESFAKIEMPVWLGYALGAGLGSKAAATSLGSSAITWYSNFFKTDKSKYVNGGGNGAAMRVQPHVWAAADLSQPKKYLRDVVRNAVTTHGHVRGIAGAMIHAEALAATLREGKLPSPKEWVRYESTVLLLPEIIESDSDLKTFWLPTWERDSGLSISEASAIVAEEWRVDSGVAAGGQVESAKGYSNLVQQLGGFSESERGSGIKAALFSMWAAWAFREHEPNSMLHVVANLLGSDTDTIGTMAGALRGALPNQPEPEGSLQDRAYICGEASRLYSISQGEVAESFSYPDLLYWSPPKVPLDALGLIGMQEGLYGLGPSDPIGQSYPTRQGDASYRWCKLAFGQTVLSKRREVLRSIPPESVAQSSSSAKIEQVRPLRKHPMNEQDLFNSSSLGTSERGSGGSMTGHSIDSATDEAISSEFNPIVVGRQLLSFAEMENGIELAVAYAAILVKAKRARLKRSNTPR
jgi:ADP-ribosylglycohydrolase